MVLHLVSPAGNGKLVSTVLKELTLKVFPRMPKSSQSQARRRNNHSGSAPSGAGTRTYHPPVPSPPPSQVAEPLVPRVSPEGSPIPSHTSPRARRSRSRRQPIRPFQTLEQDSLRSSRQFRLRSAIGRIGMIPSRDSSPQRTRALVRWSMSTRPFWIVFRRLKKKSRT